MRNLLQRLFTPQESLSPPVQRARPFFAEDQFAAVYAIGDIHGCLAELLEKEAQIIADGRRFEGRKLIVTLGDHVDRGPQSRAVIEHLAGPPPEGFARISLCGNHDSLFRKFLDDPIANLKWLDSMGGYETMRSYGLDARAAQVRGAEHFVNAVRQCVPHRHYAFLDDLCGALTFGRVVFAHAGIRPGIAVPQQRDEDLMWIREPFLSAGPCLPLVVVHGHTPAEQPQFGRGRIGIDTGVFATGRLTVLRVAEGRLEVL